jgi:hypothetical protein
MSVHLSFFTSNFKATTIVYDTLIYYPVFKRQDLDPTQSSGSRPSSRPLHPLTYTFNRLPKIPIAIVHLSEQETTDRVAGRRRSQYGSLYEDLASALRLFSYQASMRYGPHIYTQIHSPPPA